MRTAGRVRDTCVTASATAISAGTLRTVQYWIPSGCLGNWFRYESREYCIPGNRPNRYRVIPRRTVAVRNGTRRMMSKHGSTGVSHLSRPDDLSEYESFWPKSDDLSVGRLKCWRFITIFIFELPIFLDENDKIHSYFPKFSPAALL